jgi:hypothetical protein
LGVAESKRERERDMVGMWSTEIEVKHNLDGKKRRALAHRAPHRELSLFVARVESTGAEKLTVKITRDDERTDARHFT